MNKLARTVVMPLALVAMVAACDKDKGSAGGAAATGPTGAAGAAAIAPAKGGLNRALAAMPADSDLIVGIDFTKVRSSALFKKYESQIMSQVGDDLQKFQATCGFNPMEKLTGVLIGGKSSGQGEMDNGTIFVRGFDKTAAIECLKKREAEQKAAGKAATFTQDGDYIEYVEDTGDDPMRALWIDDQTALLIKQGEQAAGKDALTAAANAKDTDGLMGSKAFTDLLAKTHTGQALWFVVKGDSPAMGAVGSMVKFRALYGSVGVGSGVDAVIRMWMTSADEAKTAAGDFNKQLGQLKASPFGSVASGVTVKAEAEDVVTSIKLSQDQLEQIAKLAGQFGGGGF